MTERTLEYYMCLPYKVEIIPEPDREGFTAYIPDLPGCMTSAENYEDAANQIEEAKELWLETALAECDYIPEPVPYEVDEPSGKFLVRMPRSLHGQLAMRAEKEDVSINQLVVSILSSGMGSWIASTNRSQVQFKKILDMTERNQEAIHKMMNSLYSIGPLLSSWGDEEKEERPLEYWKPSFMRFQTGKKKAA